MPAKNLSDSASAAARRDALEAMSRDQILDEFENVLYRFARLMGAQADKFDDRLSPPQFMVLKVLENKGPMRVSDVAAHLGVKNPAASMMLHAMFEHELVDRTPDPDDRRATLISVSKLGARELRLAEKSRQGLMRNITARMSDEEITSLISGLNTLADSAMAELGVNGSTGVSPSKEDPHQ